MMMNVRILLLAVLGCVFSSCDCQQSEVWQDPDPSKWETISFGGEGSVQHADGTLHLDLGVELTGARYLGEFPSSSYVLELEARRLSGSDFFCGLTFPIDESHLTLILGGWGGSVVGLSSIDGEDASENETSLDFIFEDKRWYQVRLVVDRDTVKVSLDDQLIIDLNTEGKTLSLRPGPIEACLPMGVAAWQTEAEIRQIRWRAIAN